MKKWMILCMALSISFLTACGSGRGGAGSDHPYAWTEKRDGSVQLTIEGAPEQGFVWLAQGTENGTIQVERKEDGSRENAVFSITSQGLGNGVASFLCQRESAPQDKSFAITMTLQTTQKEKLKVVQTEYVQLPRAEVSSADSPISYVLYQDTDGYFTVYLDDDEKRHAWAVLDYDETIVQPNDPEYDGNGYVTRVLGLAAGQTEMMLYDMEQGYGLRMQLTVGEDHTITVTEHHAGSYALPLDQFPMMEELNALVGSFPLPKDGRVLSCQVAGWTNEEDAKYGQIGFVRDQTYWLCRMSKTLSLATLEEIYTKAGISPIETMTVGDCAVVLYRTEAEQAAFWQDGQDRSFALIGDTSATQEELLRNVQSMIGATS